MMRIITRKKRLYIRSVKERYNNFEISKSHPNQKQTAALIKKNEKIAYLRSTLMHVPLPISGRMNKKVPFFE